MPAWATSADVLTITGATVTDEQTASAQAVVELLVGRTSDSALIRTRDLAWLKRAVAYQAAWMLAQPDIFERIEVASSSQDGASATYSAGIDQICAPLAKRAIRRLSWKGTRSVFTAPELRGLASRFYLGSDGVGAIYDYPWEKWSKL